MVDDKPVASAPGALIAAVRAHDLAALETAIAAVCGGRSTLDQPDAEGITPLLWAVREGQAGAVARLLAAGADPNIGLRVDYSPLPLSISLREYAIATLLLKTPGLDLARQGFVAATEAVIGRDVEGLQCLARHGFDLRRGVPPEAGIGNGLNRATALLFFAISSGLPRPDVVRCLLEQGADPKAVSAGSTLLSLLCSKINEYPEALRLLLEAGAQPEQSDGAGYGALHYAAAHNHTASVKMLLVFGALVHQRAHDGSFPLLWAACSSGRTVHAELLGEYDAFKLTAAEETVEYLPPAWHWDAAGSTWGGLSLAAGDGAWHGLAWANSAEEVMSALDRMFGSSRGRTPPCLVVRLPDPPKQACRPVPWLSPGRTGKFRIGQIVKLTYFAPFFPSGVPRALPSAMIYRFLLARAQDAEKYSHLKQVVAPVVIMTIVAFEEGRRLDLHEVKCHFDGQKWSLDTPMPG